MSGPELAIEVQRALQDGQARLRELAVGHDLTEGLFRALQARSDHAETRRELSAVATVLASVASKVDTALRAQARREPLGDAWFDVKSRELEQLSGEGRQSRWAQMWWAALTAGRFELCGRVLDLPTSPRDTPIGTAMRAVSAAFACGRPADALPGLEVLAPIDGPGLLPGLTVALSLLRVRVHLRATDDRAAARYCALAVFRRAQDLRNQALTSAVLAEVHLAEGDVDSAARLVDIALLQLTDDPDVPVVAGLVEQQQSNWRRMDDFYDEAADRIMASGAQLGLLHPAPANMRWRLARKLAATHPEQALEHIVAAIGSGIVGRGPFPQRKALVDKAKIEQRLGAKSDDGDSHAAAHSYAAAADCYAWSGNLPRAFDLYEQAHRLAPKHVGIAWAYAESLRPTVEDADSLLDVQRGDRAWDLLRTGLARRRPAPDEAWVLATAAILSLARRDPASDPVLELEQSLMLDDRNALTHVWLVAVLRLGGHVREAVERARLARRTLPRDPAVRESLAAALADAGDLDEALELVTRRPGNDDLSIRGAIVHLYRHDPHRALAALAELPSADLVLLLRGLSLEAAGREEEAAETFEEVWQGRQLAEDGTVTKDRRNVALAAFHTGRNDQALRILADLEQRGPRNLGHRLDYGLALVVGGDLDAGRQTLLDAVTTSICAEDLLMLVHVHITATRSRLGGHPSPAAVAALADAQVAAERRVAELCEGERPASGAASRAAAARSALLACRFGEAIDNYTVLVDETPETAHPLRRAVHALMDRGDRLLREGDADGARATWTDALRGATSWPELTAELQARITLSSGGAAPGRGDARAPAAQQALRIVYQLGRADVQPSAVFPLFTPIEATLPARRGAMLTDRSSAITTLRTRLAAETGVRIPGGRVVDGPEEPDLLTIAVYGEPVHRSLLPAGATPFTDEDLVDTLRLALAGHMHRMLGVDDVDLWLDGWGEDPGVPPWAGRPLDDASRLRLARVLRRLLREGVPINDREAVMDGLRYAEEHGASSAEILRTVRRRLGPDVLSGGRAEERRLLPDPIADLVAAGLVGQSWMLSRSQVATVKEELAMWRSALPENVVAVVERTQIRPIVWRLLAAGGARTPVLSTEEIGP